MSRRTLLRGSVTTLGLAAGGVLFSGTAAHALDIYNPFSGYRMTGTWQDHLNSGSLGGLDYGMGVGTALPAAGAGVVTNIPNNGTGGHTVTITHSDGYRTQYMHLSQFLLANGTSVGKGAIVGRSGGAVGAPGSGSSTGPHVHWHLITPGGTRVNPLNYLGGGGGLPKSTTEQDGIPGPIMWKRTQNWLRIESGYTGPIDGVPGTNTYAALQRNMRNWGYTGPIDGVMGPNSWAAVQRLAAANGYTGPIDGAMGPNSWRGFGHFINQDRWD
ncbi:peptidoglycan DD-metalloendopeptidase family protein [Streptomyces sp. NBC_00887]|uniref:peptidoglycan DD-metalloendopeptidase family protein n=1 Tax=Streptomyces sp. NBC_00887 TaxID=2975859 RepID=UPI003868A11F|nr:peptidoglycan DD-metalloendopeptidase family protein [Streptomyces sp. NBC_00887]WSY35654.1 peptidoglycan DD-metalloendopeptidase family protein [Streptomyces sp. NBC_00887]